MATRSGLVDAVCESLDSQWNRVLIAAHGGARSWDQVGREVRRVFDRVVQTACGHGHHARRESLAAVWNGVIRRGCAHASGHLCCWKRPGGAPMNGFLAGTLLWPVTERMAGRNTMRRFRSLRASDRFSARTLADIQTRKLATLLALADEHCPFYRERFRAAGVDVSDSAIGLHTLTELPLLERDDVQQCLDEMTWPDCPGGPPQPYATGGSTGRPLRLYIDRCRQSADWAARWRHRSWWGIRPGAP
jgi:hypothetical protein